MPHRQCKYMENELRVCSLIASFGHRDGNGTQFCSHHKGENMINLLCKLCHCGRARPTYNLVGLSASFCKECKSDEMINVNDKKCVCGKAVPTFNLKGLKSRYCAKCKTKDMINVSDKPCVCGKSTRPNFNYEGIRARYCSQCKLENMCNVSHKKCKCERVQPSFNFEGLTPEYCAQCKEDGMIMIHKRLCIDCGENQATYNMYGEKPRYCNECRTDEMINVADKCKFDGCTRSGNVKYRFFCTFCFQHLFPKDPLTMNMKKKTKETYVRDFINTTFEGFSHDEPMWTGNCDCTHRRRIDHRKMIGNTLLCIETDEHQHNGYDKKDEEIRYDDLFMIHGGKFIFIRFNPDRFTNHNGIGMNPDIADRMDVLEKEIKKQINRIKHDDNEGLLEIQYLFYNGYKLNN